MEKAQASWQGRQWEQAHEGYERVLKHYPESVDAWRGLAQVQAVLGKPKTSIESLKAALEFCGELEHLDIALEMIARILELHPHNLEAHQQRIDLLFKHGRVADGVEYSRALAAEYQSRDEGEKAIKLLVRAFQLNPSDIEVISILAEAYLAHGLLREATGLFRQILPMLTERGEFERAIQVLRRLAVVNPKDIETFLDLGDLYLSQERLQEAEQQYRAVLRVDLQHRGALFKVAKVCAKRKQFRDSTLIYQRLISADSEDTEALYELGLVYKEQGMPQDAVKNLLMAGLASFDKEDKELARNCFSAVLQIEPENSIAARQLKVLT